MAQLLNSCLPTLCVGLLAFYPLGQPPSYVDFNICLLLISIFVGYLVIFYLTKVVVVDVCVAACCVTLPECFYLLRK